VVLGVLIFTFVTELPKLVADDESLSRSYINESFESSARLVAKFDELPAL
jgi:hypothetical protein